MRTKRRKNCPSLFLNLAHLLIFYPSACRPPSGSAAYTWPEATGSNLGYRNRAPATQHVMHIVIRLLRSWSRLLAMHHLDGITPPFIHRSQVENGVPPTLVKCKSIGIPRPTVLHVVVTGLSAAHQFNQSSCCQPHGYSRTAMPLRGKTNPLHVFSSYRKEHHTECLTRGVA